MFGSPQTGFEDRLGGDNVSSTVRRHPPFIDPPPQGSARLAARHQVREIYRNASSAWIWFGALRITGLRHRNMA
jgi:hypothetical protein